MILCARNSKQILLPSDRSIVSVSFWSPSLLVDSDKMVEQRKRDAVGVAVFVCVRLWDVVVV